MSEIKWIKIATNIFSDEKVKMIKSLPGGRDILLIWFQLLSLAGRTNNLGVIYLTPNVPYTEEMLAISFDENLATIKIALQTFQQFGMIEIDEDNFICICNWEKHQNVEGMERVKALTAARNKKYREKKKLQIESDVSVTSRDAIDIDKELDKEINNKDHLMNQFNEFWTIYPKKQGKKKAVDSFLKVLKNHSFEVLMNGTRSYIDHIKKEGKQNFVKNATTFLNGEHFLDEYEVVIKTSVKKTESEPSFTFEVHDE